MMIIRRKSMNQGVLMRDITISTPFTTRETAGGRILNRSLAEITSITGNTLVLNQLADSSEEVHVAGLTKANITTFDKAKVGDKLYIKVKVKKESVITFVDPGVSTTEEIFLRVGDANSGQRVMLIDDIPTDVEYHVVSALVTNGNADNDTLVVSSTNIDEIYVKDAVIINLTRMYGSGNEPTLKEFEQTYPLDYYEQTDGRLLDFKGTTLVSKDSSENVLDTVSLDVTTLTGKLCEKIFPDGLKRAGNVYDEIKVENGLLYAIKRVGSVNIGSLTTTYLTVSDVNFFQCTIPHADMLPSTPNIISALYLCTNVPFGDVDNLYIKPHDTIGNYIYIRNDSYTTAASFKNSMNGILLYYELATELRYLIDTTDPYIAKYKVDGWGTEEIVLDTNACSPSMTINYPDGSTENTRFTYRKTADGTKLNVNGDAFITNLKGETVAWNLLILNGNFANGLTAWSNYGTGSTVSVENGKLKVVPASNNQGAIYNASFNTPLGHKMYYDFKVNSPTTGTMLLYKSSNNVSGFSLIVGENHIQSILTVNSGYSGTHNNTLFRFPKAGETYYLYDVMAFDLTLIYGAGKEPTSVATFKSDYLKWFGKPLNPYTTYSVKTLLPSKMLSIKTVGYNLWDEQWARLQIKMSGDDTNLPRLSAKNYIKVTAGEQYRFVLNRDDANTSNRVDIWFYDVNKNIMSYTALTARQNFIPPVGTCYARFSMYAFYGSDANLTYHNDICIHHVGNGTRSNEYHLYWSNTTELNTSNILGINPSGNNVTIFSDGMKSARNVYDYIGKENGLWVAYKRVGSVDLGLLSWSTGTHYDYANLYAPLSGALTVPTYAGITNFTTSRYIAGSAQNTYDGKSNIFIRTNTICINDSSYNDAVIFKGDMSGSYLNYELATPQKYILDNTMHWLYKIDQQGVEEILPQNTSVPTTSPAKLNIKYKTIKPTQLIKVSLTNTNLRSCRVLYGLPYSVKILPYDGFSLYEDPIIKMGGVDITSTAYDATYNTITITSVTGDVDIECYAMHTMPSGYVRVDGIKNPNNAVMDTGYKVTPNDRLELDFVLVWAVPSTYDYIAYSGTNSAADAIQSGWRIFMNTNPTYSGCIQVRCDTQQMMTNFIANTNTIGKRHLFVADYHKGVYTADGDAMRAKNTGTVLNRKKESVDDVNFFLFSASSSYGERTKGQIVHHFKIYDYSTTSYVRYYIPCINDNGVIGFWDAAQGTFVGSSNGTAFSSVINGKKYVKIITTNTNLPTSSWELADEGEEYTKTIIPNEGYTPYEVKITMGGVDITSTAWDSANNTISISSVTDDINIECYAMHTMPSDYIRVDGIKNPSNAYINTGYKTSYKNVIKVDFTKAAGYVISSKASGSTSVIGTVIRVYANGTINYDQNASGMRSAGNGSDTGRNTWIFNHYDGGVYLNGTKILTYNKGSYTDANNMWIYQCPVAAGQTSSTGMIIHFFSIFDATTKVYERYYIPCLNASGVAGFWDASRGIFQGSSNSTAFEEVFGNTTISSQFTKRTTADGATLALPTAKVISVKGNTLVWNQLVNGEERTATGYFGVLSSNFTSVSGHRYYIRFDAIANVDNTTRGFVIGNTSSFISSTISATLNSSSYTTVSTYRVINSDSTYAALKRSDKLGNSVTIKNLVIIDLSQMFGYDNEPSVADFEKMFFPNVFYSKAAPSLLNFTATSLASKNAVGTTIGTANLDVTTITGKVNGEGESVAIFPDGMKMAGSVYDEIVKEDGVWVAYQRVGTRAYASATDGSDTTVTTDSRSYTNYPLDTPIKYTLDNPLPEYYKALTGGVEQILPENGAAPTTSPANMSITYKTIE